MKLTQEELDYLKNKYGGTFEIVTEKPIEYAAKFQMKENSHPALHDIEIIISDKKDSIEVIVLAAYGKSAGKLGVSYGIGKEQPIRCIYEAINLSLDDILTMYKEKDV